MSEHLQQAKNALAAAKGDLDTWAEPDALLSYAAVEAAIAQAEALERVADRLDSYITVRKHVISGTGPR